ncbi:Protein argonaute 10, partial [Tetrabaena socialis]
MEGLGLLDGLANGRAARPGSSTAGRAIEVLTNHVKLEVNIGTVYQYEVEVARLRPPAAAAAAPAGTPSKRGPKDKGGRRGGAGPKVLDSEAHAVLSYLLDTTATGEPGVAKDAWVYDGGATLFTGVALRRTAVLDVGQSLRDGQQQQQQGQTAAATRPAGSLTAAALAVVELVSRASAVWQPDTVRTGAGTFVSYKQPGAALEGLLPLKVLNGFRAAASLVAAGPTLTLDFASSVVAEDGPLLRQLEASLGASNLAKQLGDKFNASRLESAMAGLEVKSSHLPYTWALAGGVTKQSTRDTKFKDDSGRSLSVETYFKERYAITLARPDLPCALDRKGSALPLELL